METKITLIDMDKGSVNEISALDIHKYVKNNTDIIDTAFTTNAKNITIYLDSRRANDNGDKCTGFVAEYENCKLDVLWAKDTYGGKEGLCEIHLLDTKDNHIYPQNTDFEYDVIGYQSPEAAKNILEKYKDFVPPQQALQDVVDREKQNFHDLEDLLLHTNPIGRHKLREYSALSKIVSEKGKKLAEKYPDDPSFQKYLQNNTNRTEQPEGKG